MADKRDYYEVLGVSRDASANDIKKAYRKLAMKHHPDVNRHDENSEEAIKEINEAYSVLNDPQKREMYNLYGHDGLKGRPGFGFEGFPDFGDFGDIFDAFFGSGGRGRARDFSGADLQYEVKITLEEAASGVEREISYKRQASCGRCSGTGAQPDSAPETCSVCRGTGQVRSSSQTILGSFSTISSCSACGGTGRIIKNPCTSCGGTGRVEEKTKRKVNIPAGIHTDTRIRISGGGDAGLRGAASGDLYLFVHVVPHEFFERRGDDIICEIPVNFVQAALGDTIDVQCLSGVEKLEIPAGTQTGRTFKLKGKGIPNLNSGRPGDQHVIVRTVIPTDLNDEQRELLLRYAEISGIPVNPAEDKGIIKRLFKK